MRTDYEATRVAALVSLRSNYGRRILKGISAYTHRIGNWILHIGPSSEETVPWLRSWKPMGVIAHVGSESLRQVLTSSDGPLVNISSGIQGLDLPRVGIDDDQVGVLAAETFIERGFCHFAYCGNSERGYSIDRHRGFARTLETHGYFCHQFDDPSTDIEDQRDWVATETNNPLGQWLSSLPKPVGILVQHDFLGFHVSEVCRQFKLHVPEQIALIGVGDDDVICEMTYPPLSSIRSPLEQLGYRAAESLDRLMQGESDLTEPLLLPPQGLITRLSSDITAISDPKVALAVRFIHEHANQPVQVADVVEAAGVSRRWLEKQFQQVLGRSPLEELHRVRVNRAKRLLLETVLPVAEIAAGAGFSSASQLNEQFKKIVGSSPATYRRYMHYG